MFDPFLTDKSDELCISNLIDCESNPDDVDRILSNMEIVENFSFYDKMELIDS